MRDMQRRRHRQKVPELVPGSFLHLDEKKTTSYEHPSKAGKGAEEERRTLSLVAVLGSMTLRMSRVSCEREVPT
jgi:hypothetical protein